MELLNPNSEPETFTPANPVMIGSRVLVKKEKPRGQTRSGLVLPGNMKAADYTEGEVTAVGPGILLPEGQRHAMQCRVGDRVLLGPRVVEVRIDDAPFYVVDEGDILAILR